MLKFTIWRLLETKTLVARAVLNADPSWLKINVVFHEAHAIRNCILTMSMSPVTCGYSLEEKGVSLVFGDKPSTSRACIWIFVRGQYTEA